MENKFINGFEQFKKRIDAIPDEQLIKDCEALGMEFEQEIPKYHQSIARIPVVTFLKYPRNQNINIITRNVY